MNLKQNIAIVLKNINSENKRKKFLIYFFTSTALLALLAFGIKGVADGRITYTIIISVFFIFAFANLIILKIFNKIKLSAHIVLLLMFTLELALFSSLGAGTSGLFWYYVFPPLAITLLDNKKGTIYSFILIAVTFIILVVKPDFLINTYPKEIIIRFIFTYFVLNILINIFEYARNTAHKAYLSNLTEIKEKNEELISAEEELRQNNEELQSLNENIVSQKDIIENKNQELQKYFTAIEQSAASIVFTNIKGNIEYANPQFAKLTGYTIEEALGKNPRILKSGKTPKSRIKELWDTILNKKTWRGEFINIKKDGTEFYEQAIITPIINDKGETTDFIAVKEDVTERKKAEQIITEQNKQISFAHKKITQSINYAKSIQNALLPTQELENKLLKEHFILYLPKENVSGDFYYVNKTEDSRLLFAAADCTGHGVPGGFMTMLSITFLNEIIRRDKIITPSNILEQLRGRIKGIFSQYGTKNQNGLDIALCSVDTKTNILQYAGAYNPLWIIRNNEIQEYKATRNPIGFYPKEKEFENHEIQLQNNDLIYVFSDGYQDQLGVENNRKFTKKRFQELLLEIHKYPIDKQKIILKNIIKKWQGNIDQTDDITIMCIKWEIL